LSITAGVRVPVRVPVAGADSRRGIEIESTAGDDNDDEQDEDNAAVELWFWMVSLRFCPATAMGEGAIGRTYSY
jgi:hypothetical protein